MVKTTSPPVPDRASAPRGRLTPPTGTYLRGHESRPRGFLGVSDPTPRERQKSREAAPSSECKARAREARRADRLHQAARQDDHGHQSPLERLPIGGRRLNFQADGTWLPKPASGIGLIGRDLNRAKHGDSWPRYSIHPVASAARSPCTASPLRCWVWIRWAKPVHGLRAEVPAASYSLGATTLWSRPTALRVSR